MDNRSPAEINGYLEETTQEVETPEVTEETQEVEEAPVVREESQTERNFKSLREAKERAERERDEAYRLAQQALAQQTQQAQPKPEPEEDYDVNLGPDELAEGKHLSKFGRKIKKLEDEIKQYKQQSMTMSVEARLKSQYPDIDSVLSKDNVSRLASEYPEIAQTLQSSTDYYSTAVSAYTLIKKFGIVQEDNYMADKLRAQKNAAKPKPLASVNPQQGDSPLSKANAFANGLTDDLKKQLRKEMEDARRSI